MTNQEALNIALCGLKAQGTYGWNETTHTCRYRTASGHKCFVGMLIPDSEYHEEFDNNGSLLEVVGTCPTLNKVSTSFLRRFQSLHDTCAENYEPLDVFFKRAKEEAAIFGLEWPSDV